MSLLFFTLQGTGFASQTADMPKLSLRGLSAFTLAVSFLLTGTFSQAAESCRFVHLKEAKLPRVSFRTSGETEYDVFRANANDFWNWSRTQAPKYLSQNLLAEGLITGDPHGMNFGDLYLKGQKTQVTLIDIDDAGHGPFLVDFVRLLTAIKLSPADVKAQEVWENYLDGLFNRKVEVPEFIEETLDKTHSDWLEEQKEFIANKTNGMKLDQEELDLYPLRELSAKDQERARQLVVKIKELDPQALVKDVAYKVKEGGGSQGLLRIWVLLSRNGILSIEELKEMAMPATNYYQTQVHDQKARLEEVTKAFWGVADPNEYKVVSIPGSDFWLRPRYKYDLKLNPDKIDSNKKQKKYDEWSLYIAYTLGRLHGSQAESAPLKKILQRQSDGQNKSVIESLKEFSKAYRDRLEEKSE